MEESLLSSSLFRIQHNLLLINQLEHKLQLSHPCHLNKGRAQQLSALQSRLLHAATARMTAFSSSLTLLQTRLEAHNPEQTLRRGYALVENEDRQLIRKTGQVHAGEKLKVRVFNGHFFVTADKHQ